MVTKRRLVKVKKCEREDQKGRRMLGRKGKRIVFEMMWVRRTENGGIEGTSGEVEGGRRKEGKH